MHRSVENGIVNIILAFRQECVPDLLRLHPYGMQDFFGDVFSTERCNPNGLQFLCAFRGETLCISF